LNIYPQPGKIVLAGVIIETVMPIEMLKKCDGHQKTNATDRPNYGTA